MKMCVKKAGIAIGEKRGMAAGTVAGKLEAIRGTIALLRKAGLSEEELKSQIQSQFSLTASQMKELFN